MDASYGNYGHGGDINERINLPYLWCDALWSSWPTQSNGSAGEINGLEQLFLCSFLQIDCYLFLHSHYDTFV